MQNNLSQKEHRYELKLLLSQHELSHALYCAKMAGSYTAFASKEVNNIYFDTPDFQAVKDNLSGVAQRWKVRLRWYGKITNENPAVFEIKLRNDRVGSKRKCVIESLTEEDIQTSPLRVIKEKIFQALPMDEDFFRVKHALLLPTLFDRYDRSYLLTDQGIRITIDENIKFRNVGLYAKTFDHEEIDYNHHIMEIKFPLTRKDEASRLVSRMNLIPKRHSKYLAGLAKLGNCVYI